MQSRHQMQLIGSLLLVLVSSVGAQAHTYKSSPHAKSAWIADESIRTDLEPIRPSDSNISESAFRALVQKVQSSYAPVASSFSAQLRIMGDWRSETPNAGAIQMFGNWQVKITGGLARRPELTPDGFTLILCHEMGHHLGGFSFAPAQNPLLGAWAANEGQADYYSTHVCAKRLWQNEVAENASYRATATEAIRARCDLAWQTEQSQNLCYRTMTGALSVANTMAAIMKKPTPDLDTPDTTAVAQTFHGHPQPQCRLDTTSQAALCAVAFNESVIPGRSNSSERDSVAGERESLAVTCSASMGHQLGLRPSCWFKSRL